MQLLGDIDTVCSTRLEPTEALIGPPAVIDLFRDGLIGKEHAIQCGCKLFTFNEPLFQHNIVAESLDPRSPNLPDHLL